MHLSLLVLEDLPLLKKSSISGLNKESHNHLCVMKVDFNVITKLLILDSNGDCSNTFFFVFSQEGVDTGKASKKLYCQ